MKIAMSISSENLILIKVIIQQEFKREKKKRCQ